ncbi:hypothetical protein [Chroococcus sp. FPU101]|uniref:hypothetical protein n=1 Tax=Chroococcus sp. FPU101 TaxID=1974212 RepID=UPI001A8C4EEF|nr:hypothetical protein [Chroococcus sp. FPU101]GFE67614.1 hypothetical protein CFPU101_02240 [Chroococcus sp. FPU101]
MQVSELIWSETEKEIAHQAFNRAYERELMTLIEYVQVQSHAIKKIDDVWNLHDFLSARRHQIDGKYDFRYSVLLFVFADLLKEGWLHQEDLEGLEKDKLAKITALSRI